MPKTRVIRRVNQKSLVEDAGEDHMVKPVEDYNFETPVSLNEPAPLRPLQYSTIKMSRKALFKTPGKDHKGNYQLGVTYNIRQSGQLGVPTPGSNLATPNSLKPLGKCRKCKHINLDHSHVKRRFFVKEAKNNSGKSVITSKKQASALGKEKKNFFTPEPCKGSNSSFFLDNESNILQQIKETIVISPYVRSYLERKLKEKMKQVGKEGNSLWMQSIKGLKLGQSANLDELELVINLEQMAEGDTGDVISKEVKKQADTPAPFVKGRTYTARNRLLPVGKEASTAKEKVGPSLQTSIDMRKTAVASKMANKENKMPLPVFPSKTHQYLTRFKARTLVGGTTTGQTAQPKEKQLPNEHRFALPKTMTTRSMAKTRAAVNAANVSAALDSIQSTCTRFTRKCKTLAGNELISCGKVNTKVARAAIVGTTSTTTQVLPIRPSMAPNVKTRMPRKSNIPVFTGNKTKAGFKF